MYSLKMRHKLRVAAKLRLLNVITHMPEKLSPTTYTHWLARTYDEHVRVHVFMAIECKARAQNLVSDFHGSLPT